jgi:cytochrome c oxidase subunit II
MRAVAILSGVMGIALVSWAMTDGAVARGATPRRVVAFDVVAERFHFSPDRFEVTRGDHVRLSIRSLDGTHGFSIRKLKVDIEVPRTGEPVTVEFDADRAGQFPITCSEYCGRGHKEMKALLVVNEPGAAAATR